MTTKRKEGRQLQRKKTPRLAARFIPRPHRHHACKDTKDPLCGLVHLQTHASEIPISKRQESARRAQTQHKKGACDERRDVIPRIHAQ
jgi:hypothetical protein